MMLYVLGQHFKKFCGRMVWTVGTGGSVGCFSAHGSLREARRNGQTALRRSVPDLRDQDGHGPPGRRPVGAWEVHISVGVAYFFSLWPRCN